MFLWPAGEDVRVEVAICSYSQFSVSPSMLSED